MRRHGKRLALTLALALVAIVGSAAAGRERAERQEGVTGRFSTVLMVHTLDSPRTTPWDGSPRDGAAYSYRSIGCNGNAPVNNISSDLPSYGARVAGSSLPNSLRAHPFAFRTVKSRRGWIMRGTIKMTVCKLAAGPTPTPDPVADESKPKIIVKFKARPVRTSVEHLRWSGRFKLAGGTGRYRGLTGSGRISGYFLCFAEGGCRQFGAYRDAQFVMHGRYADRTPRLREP